MSVHARELNLENLLTVCRDLPAEERDIWKVFYGVDYEPQSAAISMFRAPGHHKIIHNGDEPLAAAGFIELRPGVFRTWMLARELAWHPYGRETTAVVREAIEDILESGVAHRVETVTLADRNRARDWYQKIGLQHEATHRKYGINGEDAVTYVALRGAESG